MKRHKCYIEPHWFDYLSLIVMLVFAVTMSLFIFNINISHYTLPVFIIYVAVASCEHTQMRKEMSEKTINDDIVSEIFTEK